MTAHTLTEPDTACDRVAAAITETGIRCADGLALWHESTSPANGSLARDLAELDIRHQAVAAVRAPAPGDRYRRAYPGQEVRVGRDELPGLAERLPRLRRAIDETPRVTESFGFSYFEPRSGGLAIVRWSALATRWPTWSTADAALMGLLCAGCDADLRHRDRPASLPFNFPHTDRPGPRRRLFCRRCAQPHLARRTL